MTDPKEECLIIIPTNDEKYFTENKENEENKKNKLSDVKEYKNPSLYLLECNKISNPPFSIIINEEESIMVNMRNDCDNLFKLLCDLSQILNPKDENNYVSIKFDDENNEKQFSRVVLCGHFGVQMPQLRTKINNICNEESCEDSIKKFKDPINCKGNFIFDSYTLDGGWDPKITQLMKSLKTAGDINNICSICREIFRLIWLRNKIPKINQLNNALFFYRQSKQNELKIPSDDDLNQKIETLKEDKEFLEGYEAGKEVFNLLSKWNQKVDFLTLNDQLNKLETEIVKSTYSEV